MKNSGLNLPERVLKPRTHGLTILIDNGVPLQFFRDTMESAPQFIDYVKFGWCTSLVTRNLKQKIECLRENDISFFFGGTLFEKFLSQNKAVEYHSFCKEHGAEYIEISNGTLDISNRVKAGYIREFAKDFTVFSEVGNKDSALSVGQHPEEWMEYIQEDLDAGAFKVITEARESGTSGICTDRGDLRLEIVDLIMNSEIPLENLIFEAPNKKMQTAFIKMAGPNVNLANIPFADFISLETLRLGLRSDTFYTFSWEEQT
ncbi:phosphosulfolactate synthase [Peribacillus sp. SCS-26]|uniref:phosphosulfolactate synthase n=1 Tax=Paraperibacillus marinus TaxID=3115295 RepID=UPI003905B02C